MRRPGERTGRRLLRATASEGGRPPELRASYTMSLTRAASLFLPPPGPSVPRARPGRAPLTRPSRRRRRRVGGASEVLETLKRINGGRPACCDALAHFKEWPAIMKAKRFYH